LDKKVCVAFEWTLDLLFRKDVCAVHRSTRRGDRYQKETPVIPFVNRRNGEGHDTSAGNLIRENKTVGWGISSSRERSGSAAG